MSFLLLDIGLREKFNLFYNRYKVMSKHLCFVYGSLLSGLGNHHVLEGAKFQGGVCLPLKVQMISLGSYPALVRGDEQTRCIHGEVYEVDDEGLQRLDFLEGHPRFYRREQTAEGFWVYILTDASTPDEPKVVKSCDWRAYYNEGRKKKAE